MQDIEKIIKNLIPENKRTIALATAAAVLFTIFIIFAYMPRQKSVSGLKKELTGMEAQIELIQSTLGDLEELSRMLAGMQKELVLFESRLPNTKQISSVLSELSSAARLCSVDVISIRPHEPVPLLDDNQNPISLDKKPLKEIKIELNLLAKYKSLAEYVKKIQESLNLLAVIEEIVITKREERGANLDIELSLLIYTGDKQQ